MPSDFDAILSRLEKVGKPDSNGNYLALCPFHDDHSPSLSLHPEKGAKCFSAGCEANKGVSLARLATKLGLSPGPASPRKKGEIEATYDYHDAEGRLLFQVVRLRDPKGFRQRRLNTEGEWEWNLRGIQPVLYKLPKLLAAPPDEWVFIVEGEKDVARLEQEGLTATTNPMGAGKWRQEYCETLKGHKVAILPDNDAPGKEHAWQVVKMFDGIAARLKVVRLPDLPPKGDICDWFDNGGSKAKLLELVETQVFAIPGQKQEQEQELEDFPPPQLPDEVWMGLFGNYRDLVAGTTEAPDTYHFASFAVAFGAVLSRRVHVYHARPIYPNFYVCLVGRSGVARKDTAWSRGREIAKRLHTDVDPTNPVFQVIPGIGSAEGLVDALAGERKTIILNESEFLSLLSKAKQEGVSNLVPKLTSLYDCPPDESIKTRNKTVLAVEPFLSIISGTTMDWLQMALSEKDIYGGFANRFMFIYGEPKGPMPFPPKRDTHKLNSLVDSINNIRGWAETLLKSTRKGEILVAPETQQLFTVFYTDYYQRCAQESMGATLIVRVQGFIWKLALLYAAMEFSEVVLPRHLEIALLAGEFLERSALYIFNEFNVDKTRAREAQIIGYLKAQNGGPVSQRDLYRALHLSATDLDRIAQPMVRFGLMVPIQVSKQRGPATVYYELP